MNKLKLKEKSEKLFWLHTEITGMYNEVAKSIGLTLTAIKVLDIIYKNKNCNQKIITQLTFLPKQTVNAIIKAFCKNGIIELNSDSGTDKRNKKISFTPNGIEYANKIISKFEEIEFNAMNSMGEETTNRLIEIITLYKENIKI